MRHFLYLSGAFQVFWKLLGTALYFDTLDNLEEYRKYQCENRRTHGLLLALQEGIKVDSSGIIDMSRTLDDVLQSHRGPGAPIKFVFGSMPQGETEEVPSPCCRSHRSRFTQPIEMSYNHESNVVLIFCCGA